MNKMHLSSTYLVTAFLTQDFLPAVEEAIKKRVAERRLVRKIPKIVTNSIVMNVFEPNLKNASKPQSKMMPKDSFP